ncbi:hypothetical protein ACO0LF_18265 [Undibacterium sp. Di27W]|uniref:hypothetical protein n=1 Tax=Undibacterium sp. Di27W TaxID=3413036 RepID=UPI003BF2088C
MMRLQLHGLKSLRKAPGITVRLIKEAPVNLFLKPEKKPQLIQDENLPTVMPDLIWHPAAFVVNWHRYFGSRMLKILFCKDQQYLHPGLKNMGCQIKSGMTGEDHRETGVSATWPEDRAHGKAPVRHVLHDARLQSTI